MKFQSCWKQERVLLMLNVYLQLLVIKSLHAKWIAGLHNFPMDDKEKMMNGFGPARINEAINDVKNATERVWNTFSENWSTILVIIFWHFLIIKHRSESPQVKRYLTSSITNLIHELPHELPNDLRLKILGN